MTKVLDNDKKAASIEDETKTKSGTTKTSTAKTKKSEAKPKTQKKIEDDAPKKNYIGFAVPRYIEIARENEHNRLHEIDLMEKDLEFINNLTFDEVEALWYLRHMPSSMARNHMVKIAQSFHDVTKFLMEYEYIKR